MPSNASPRRAACTASGDRMANFQFHSPANPRGFEANGSEDQAHAYLARLNHGRALNAWSMRQTAGRRKCGVSLTKLLDDHVAAHNRNLADTRKLLHHGNHQ
jgi:hypothetical protein